MALQLTNVRPQAPTSNGATGGLLLDLLGLNGTARVFVYSFQGPGGSALLVFDQVVATPATDVLVPGLATGNYDVAAYNTADYDERSGFIYFVAPYVPVPRGGCTDPSALNRDPAATFDDGTCQYAPPPVPAPVFVVPLLNPLRFVQVEIPDGCETFETLDNTLFCQQQRPGMQRRPLFFQPVNFCDPLAVQVLSNYALVDAVVHRHADGQVLRPQALARSLVLQGPAPDLAVVMESAGDGYTRLTSESGVLPPSLLAAPRLALRLAPGGPLLRYRVLRAGRATVTAPADFVVISRPYDGPVGGAPAVSWLLSGPGFNVWEGNVNLSGLPRGEYEVRLHGYDGANRSATAISEPIHWAEEHPNTVVVDYGNPDNAFGAVFATGWRARLRVPATFFRPTNGGTVTTHRNSDDSVLVLASTAQRLIQFEAYQLPAWLHEKLYLIFRLDFLRVNGLRCQTGDAYETTEQRGYPLSSGRVKLEQVGWLGAGNGDDALPNDSGDANLVLRSGGFLKLRGK